LFVSAALWSKSSEMFRFAQHDRFDLPELSEANPGITLKAA
jgi:hypothetical protein